MPLFQDVCEIPFKYCLHLSKNGLRLKVPSDGLSGQRDGELCAGEELGSGCYIKAGNTKLQRRQQ